LSRRKPRETTPKPAPKTLWELANEIRNMIRAFGKTDKESVQKLLRQVRAGLLPRKPRRASSDTIKAAQWRMDGQEWPAIYKEIFGDRWQYRLAHCHNLRRNAKRHLKKLMREGGAPAGMTIAEWIKQRQKNSSPMSAAPAPVTGPGKGTPTDIE
jgi:hypothetical protein